MSMKLIYMPGNPRAGKILVAAKLANVDLQSEFVLLKQFDSPAFLNKNPVGKIPILETPEGYLTESNAIIQYIARGTPLIGTTDFQQAKVRQWLDFTTSELESGLLGSLLPILGYDQTTLAKQAEIKKELNWKLKIVDNHLKANNFLVGEQLTVADLNLASYFYHIFTFVFDNQERKTIPNILRWYKYVSEIPAFLSVFGRTRYCKVNFPLQLETTEVKVEQKVEQKAEQKVEQKQQPKQNTQKQQQPKQEQKKAEVQAVQIEEEDQPKKKEQNELDKLPPSTFDIDNWKRIYLASANTSETFQQFWSTFDSAGWSIWIVKYIKAEGEGKVLISFRNNCNGFLQRCDPHFKKYAFAIHGVYGDIPNLNISGAWIWRGTEIPQQLKDHPTFEYLEITKLDASKPEDRTLFEEYWLNQTEDESKVQGQTARALYYFR